MLNIFKREESLLSKAKKLDREILYLIDFDENGAFLTVANSNFKVIEDYDYNLFSGVDREILYLLKQNEDEEFFNISWDEDSNKSYLYKTPRLIELLKNSNKLYFAKTQKKINFGTELKRVNIKISPQKSKQIAQAYIDESKEFKLLDSNFALIKDTIYPLFDLGNSYKQLEGFSTELEDSEIEEFLSIIFSHFENIDIEYNDYKLEHKPQPKLIKPAIIFEEITQDNELIFKLSATFGKLSAQFFNDFSITKIAILNELESIISIYECNFEAIFQEYNKILKIIQSIKRKNKNSSFSEDGGVFILDEEIAKEFIFSHLHTLISSCEIFGSQKLKKYKYNTKKPTLNVSFKDKIDYLDQNEVTVSIGEESFNIFELIKLYKTHNYIPLKNGEKSIIDKNYISKLERIFKKDGKKIKVSFFDLPEIEELIATKEQKVFKSSREFYEGFNKIKSSKLKLPKTKDLTLRDYQKYGIKWLKYLYDNNFGGCLADDMGLGKTLQAIMLLSLIYQNSKNKLPSLVVMPKSLLINWQNEIEKFNPNLKYYSYYGSNRDISKISQHQVILTTYAMVRNDIKELKEIEFDTVVLDESQHIKNIDSKVSKAVMLLNAKHKFALSGTPIENSLFELYSLFRFLNEGMFSTIANFKRDYVVPIQSEANEEVAKVLKAKISPFILRRLKQDVLTELPPKQEQIIYVDMEESHKKLYNQRKNYYKQMLSNQISTQGIEKSRFAILQAFNDLRQIASAPELKTQERVFSSKIEQLFDMLEDIVANRHKVLIFANFLGSLDLIATKANEYGYKYLTMTGSTQNRAKLVDKFQNDSSYQLFLMTLKVGGVGLNLTKADYVFIFDPWWNVSAENQAIDRVHRMGQKNRVFSYKLITKETIEEKILQLQSQKEDLTNMVISGDDGGLKKLTPSDLEYILG